MSIYEIEKLATPSPWHAEPYDPTGGCDCITGAVDISAGKRTIATLDEQHRRTVGDGLDAGMRRMEQHKQLLADAALLCHCRNHFMEALAALKQISKETSNGEPSMGALVARGWLEKLEKVQ